MLNIVGSLLQRKSRSITTRIPHQSENAFGAFPDSFPPGEAILRRIVSKLNNNLPPELLHAPLPGSKEHAADAIANHVPPIGGGTQDDA